MPNKLKNFITINDSFICQNCGAENPPAFQTCRNHCKECLYSLHVDQETPGDRESNCRQLMKPVEIGQDGKKGFFVVHECQKCGKQIRNKLADDDNWETVCSVNQF